MKTNINLLRKVVLCTLLAAPLAFDSQAQGCLVNTLNFTSAIDNSWKVTALTPGLAGETSEIPPYNYPALAVTDVTTDYKCQGTNYINFINTLVHNNSVLNGAEAESMVVTRYFKTCVPDTFRLALSVAADNNISAVWFNSDASFYFQLPTCDRENFNSCDSIIRIIYLPAGDHKLSIRVSDCSQSDVTVDDAMGVSIVGSFASRTVTNSLVAETSECADFVCSSSCDDNCYWKLSGNNIVGSNNIFGTLTNDDVRIKTNNTDRGIFTKNGLLGWNTMSPTAYLHVNCAGNNLQGASDIRFQNLENNPNGTVLVIDQLGYVYNSGQPLGSRNTCTTTNMVPKTTTSTGTMGCSQIFDNGTSVGIGLTSGFAYSWSGSGLYGGTTAPASSGNIRLGVNGVTRSLAYIATSDGRLKSQVKDIKEPLKIISGLNGKTYNWNAAVLKETEADNSMQYGFIAQEVAKVMPEAVVIDENGNYGLNYNFFIPVLTESQKELFKLYQEEKQTNEELRKDIDRLAEIVKGLENCCSESNGSVAPKSGNALYQNTPNPFNQQTTIEYYVQQLQSAYIGIYDLNGKELAQYPIAKSGKGTVTVESASMISGMYIYSLIVDGQLIDSKKMVLNK